jgi:radical SAM protein with 4Fe4S-binding SPASM domain
MEFRLWEKIVGEVAHKSPGTKIWPALMGEPLLMGNTIFEWIGFAKDMGIQYIALNTNLQAFKQEMLDPLFNSRVDEVLVGFDGITPGTYEKIRVKGKFERLLRALELILEEKEQRGTSYPQITLQFIVMDENEHEEQAFIDYWMKSGRKVKLKIKPRTGWADAVKPWSGIVNVSQDSRHLPCTWLLRQMTIFWNGKVPQCDGDYNGLTDFGDVNTQTIEEIWNSKLKKIRNRHMNLDFNFSPCNKCEDWQAGRSVNIICGDEK